MVLTDMIHDFFTDILADGLFAAIAAIGFSSISNTPRRAYGACALTAALGHAVRYVLTMPGVSMNIVAASSLASVVVGIMAVMLSRRIKCPAEVCFFPALLPMIPGMYAYRTVEALVLCVGATAETEFAHRLYLFMSNGLTCAFIIIGMVIGATVPVFAMKKIAFRATRQKELLNL